MTIVNPKQKKLLDEYDNISIAIELISLGARMQLLESETHLKRPFLVKLYKEIKGNCSPKGLLPFSESWFVIWEKNIHSSFFYNIYSSLEEGGEGLSDIKTLIQSYKIYREQCAAMKCDELLSLNRAWTLVKFIDSKILSMMQCTSCFGSFVTYAYQLKNNFSCVFCQPPSRAIKNSSPRILNCRIQDDCTVSC